MSPLSRRTWRTLSLAAGVVATIVAGPAVSARAEPPDQIPTRATEADARWQPAVDYDTDGCYATPAIGADGVPAGGLAPTGRLSGDCRDAADLANSNAYVRTRCDGAGWCGHVYALYFEKDQVLDIPGLRLGHRHDLEHVIVWVHEGEAAFVSVSAHGDYAATRPADEVRWQGTHPKIVYHKEGLGSHVLRFAGARDDAVENHTGRWHYPALLSWPRMTSAVRDGLQRADFGAANLDLRTRRLERVLADDAAATDGLGWRPPGTLAR